jgi:energy-coupling factor transporter ATP-binding protein EcfA2
LSSNDSTNRPASSVTLEQDTLELLAQYDRLLERCDEWIEQKSAWEPIRESQALLRRTHARVESLKIKLEAPLIVATYGGTGTGKSSLVNALVGQTVTSPGKQRPTTRKPICLAHPDTNLNNLNVNLNLCDVVRVDTPLLKDILLIDCPDPDTSEATEQGSNLEILNQILPLCDVLIYVSTQQKYRSARVFDELMSLGQGCRLVFVQTHADLDIDIREDWKKQLETRYAVPEMFFVNTPAAIQEQQQGKTLSGDFDRLQTFLLRQLASAQRGLIRRANGLDLLETTFERCQSTMRQKQPALAQLQLEIERQQQLISTRMTDELQASLSESRHLWEKRLLGEVSKQWGSSPFSLALRVYYGLGNLIASASLLRARSTAHVALIGAIQGARYLSERSDKQGAEERLNALDETMVNETLFRESWMIISGYLQGAGFGARWIDGQPFGELKREASQYGRSYLQTASQRIDQMIEVLARQNSGFQIRMVYETLFGLYLAFILFRVGRNFFVVSFWDETKILAMDFYIPALIFFILWSTTLLIFFSRQLSQGVDQKIAELSGEMVQQRLSGHLFPRIQDEVKRLERAETEMNQMQETVHQMQRHLQEGTQLGGRRDLN